MIKIVQQSASKIPKVNYCCCQPVRLWVTGGLKHAQCSQEGDWHLQSICYTIISCTASLTTRSWLKHLPRMLTRQWPYAHSEGGSGIRWWPLHNEQQVSWAAKGWRSESKTLNGEFGDALEITLVFFPMLKNLSRTQNHWHWCQCLWQTLLYLKD